MNFTEEEGVLETADGRTIGWMLRGPADGTVVGWFHGQPGSRRDVRAFTPETLSRFGFRLLAIDRAGYGDTSAAAGHTGLLEDGLRTVSTLEFDLSDVRCPVRAIHGTIDDLEPCANLERAAARLTDCVVLTLPGMGHFGPWLWPDSIFGLVSGH